MICEECGNEHDGSYGSGRFCSNHCRHVFIGKQAKNRSITRPRKHHIGNWKCCHCGLVFNTRRLLTEHKHNEHPHPKGHPWNKGLTKETSELVKKQSETFSRKIAAGEITPSMKGKHWSEEDKKRISEQRKQYLKLHPEKVPYVLNHSSKESFPEQFFRKAFTNEGFPKFTQDKYVNGYFLDFAFEGLYKYIEVDGEQHYLDKKIVEHDIIRQKNLSSTEWKCVCRIRWARFQKLSNECKHRFIMGLKSKLMGKENEKLFQTPLYRHGVNVV